MTSTIGRLEVASVSVTTTGLRERWPATASRRWLMRLALAEPYALLVLVADARGIASPENLRLERAGELVDWGADEFTWVAQAYPPVPTALASLLPGGVVMLGFVGAVCAGVILQVLWERMHQRSVPAVPMALLLLSVGATPAFLFSSTHDLAAFLGMSLFTVALAGLLRFAVDGDTEGGFQCGLALGVAAMCDPATAIFAVLLGIAAPLVAWRRYRGEPGAVSATFAVVLFPTVAAFAGWAFLEWRFTGGAYASIRTDPLFLDFPGGVLATLVREIGWMVQRLAITPVYVVVAVLLVARRRTAFLVPILPPLAVLLTQFLGLHLATGQGLVILATAALMIVPADPSRRVQFALALAAVYQVTLAWIPWRPGMSVAEYTERLLG